MGSKSVLSPSWLLTASALLFSGILAMPDAATAASATPASVVQIECGKKTGVGVAWKPGPNQETHIVTTLHLVAGWPTCVVRTSQGQTTNAQIVRVYYPSDLALLALDWSDFAGVLKPLEIGQISNAGAKYFTFQNGRVQAKSIRVDPDPRGTPLKHLHARLQSDRSRQAAFGQKLCQQPTQYPSLEAKVQKLKNPVRSGDSGAPITQNGRVVGLIDGGYKPAGVAPAYWSVDAADFQKLAHSQTPLPANGVKCANQAKQLYSADAPAIPKIPGVELEPIFSADFGEIYAEMEPADRQEVNSIAAANGLTIQQLAPNVIDVYQDGVTGAILALPRGFSIETEQNQDAQATYIEVFNPAKDVAMLIYVENDYRNYESPELYADRQFLEYLKDEVAGGSAWQKNSDDSECYPGYCQRFYLGQFDAVDAGGPFTVLGTAVVTTNDDDLLGMSLMVKKDLKGRAVSDLVVVMSCMLLADFAYF